MYCLKSPTYPSLFHFFSENSFYTIANGKIVVFFYMLALSTYLSGCGGSQSISLTQSDCQDKNLDLNCFPKPDSNKVKISSPHIRTINVFVETSLSMSGYMPAKDSATEFQTIIPEIISSLNTAYPQKINFYSIYDSKVAYTKLNLDTSRNRILAGRFNWNGNTYLPDMLDTVMKKYLKGDVVNVFVSDCIYSPETKDKKATSLAVTDIRDETIPMTKDYSTIMVALSSRFVTKKKITQNSPYYMIIQGKAENLAPVKNHILTSIERYHGQHNELNFERPQKNPGYSALPYTDKTSNFSAESATTYNGAYIKLDQIDLNTIKDLSFWVGIDLKNLPAFAQSTDYLKKNLIPVVDQGIAILIDVRNSPPDNLSADDKTLVGKYTHFIKIKLTDLTGDVGALKLSLKYTRPKWVHDQGETDPAKENIRNKTLGLEKLVTGYEEAYGLDKEYYFFNNITFSLIRKS